MPIFKSDLFKEYEDRLRGEKKTSSTVLLYDQYFSHAAKSYSVVGSVPLNTNIVLCTSCSGRFTHNCQFWSLRYRAIGQIDN